MQRKEQQTLEQKISRRRFLQTTGLTIASAIAIETIDSYIHDSQTYSQSELLQQTAVALEETGRQSPFEEKNGFTEELFQSARKSTYVLRIIGNKTYTVGTGFIVETQNETCYMATTRHAFDIAGDRIDAVEFWRPNIDTHMFDAVNLRFTASNEHDLAVLSFSFGNNRLSYLPWRDHFLLKKDDKILIVGYPMDFKDKSSDYGYFTMGSVMSVFRDADKKTGNWYAKGLVNFGSSGSPVILNKDGKATAVGIISASLKIDGEHAAMGTMLDLMPLINQLKDRSSKS